MYVLDTNILIYHAAAEKESSAFFDEHATDVFYIPSIVVAEFLSYPLITNAAVSAFRNFVSQMVVVNLDFRIAELSSTIRRAYKVKLIDAIVAATALSTNSMLVTKNTRDFKKIKELKLFEF